MKDETKHLQRNEAMWDQWADSLDGPSRRSRFLREAQRKVISMLDVQPDVRFLDIGCGTGWAVGQVANLANGTGLFYGVDLSPRMIEKARNNFGGRDNFRFIQANSESIPLQDDFFDILICTNSFHHYLNPDKALKEMYRLLKKGGKLFILDPTADTWIAKLADRIIRTFEPEHVKMYSTAEFQELFEGAGLTYASSRALNQYQGIHIAQK